MVSCKVLKITSSSLFGYSSFRVETSLLRRGKLSSQHDSKCAHCTIFSKIGEFYPQYGGFKDEHG